MAAKHPDSSTPGPIEPRMRVRFQDGDARVFGPGVYRLLVQVAETGSLHRAAQVMGMSYSKAWRIVRIAEVHLRVELLERHAGGASGGGSVLTADGRALVERFGHLQHDLQAALDALFAKYFGDQPYARHLASAVLPGQARDPSLHADREESSSAGDRGTTL
jgi:molybdate transport system regulatory protein